MTRYTAFVSWPLQIAGGHRLKAREEVDVDAKDIVNARTQAEGILKEFYETGWHIDRIEERFGLYF